MMILVWFVFFLWHIWSFYSYFFSFRCVYRIHMYPGKGAENYFSPGRVFDNFPPSVTQKGGKHFPRENCQQISLQTLAIRSQSHITWFSIVERFWGLWWSKRAEFHARPIFCIHCLLKKNTRYHYWGPCQWFDALKSVPVLDFGRLRNVWKWSILGKIGHFGGILRHFGKGQNLTLEIFKN